MDTEVPPFKMEARIATLQDIRNWLVLAEEVEPLFGPMVSEPSFREALENGMEEDLQMVKKEPEVC